MSTNAGKSNASYSNDTLNLGTKVFAFSFWRSTVKTKLEATVTGGGMMRINAVPSIKSSWTNAVECPGISSPVASIHFTIGITSKAPSKKRGSIRIIETNMSSTNGFGFEGPDSFDTCEI